MKTILFLACLLFTPGLFGGATIEGTVPPVPAASLGASAGRYQINHSGAVAKPDRPQAVVYLEGNFGNLPPKQTTARMAQQKFQFSPGILAIQKGTIVEFPNLDDDYHNVFSYSKPKRFDLGRYRKDEKPAAQVFDKPGVVKLYCEIHEHMRGTILVLDSPFFTKSEKGAYKLDNLPAGKYTLKCWIDEKAILEKQVELKDGETIRVDFAK